MEITLQGIGKEAEDQVEPIISATEKKNQELEWEYNRSLDLATKNTLEQAGEVSNSNGFFDKRKFDFVRRNLKLRTSPKFQGRQSKLVDSSHSEVMANLLNANVYVYSETRKETLDKFVVAEHVERIGSKKDKRIFQIYYGAGNSTEDLENLNELLSDPEEFLNSNLGYRKAKSEDWSITINVLYPDDIPANEKVVKHLNEQESKINSESSGILIKYKLDNIPFDADKVKVLDRLIEKNKKEVTRHPSELFLEVREVTIKNLLTQITSELPENSALLKLIKTDFDFVVKQVYESIKNYHSGNSEAAMGYMFEAAVAIEMRDGVLDDTLSEMFWQIAHNNKKEVIDLSSEDFRALNKEYQEFMASKWHGHGDFIITDDDIADGKKVRKISALIECKSSSSESIPEYVRNQIVGEVGDLEVFVEKHNKTNREKIAMLPIKDIKVILIKPLPKGVENKPSNRTGKQTFVGFNSVAILRSAISEEDIEIVRKYMGTIIENTHKT